MGYPWFKLHADFLGHPKAMELKYELTGVEVASA
jgi:hypothetical protein